MKSKTTAVIVTLFLGGLGGHKFYLGETGKGFLYLIFCWTFIPGILAFIDLISLLLMGQERFDLKYNRLLVPVTQASPAQPTIVINNVNNSGLSDANSSVKDRPSNPKQIESSPAVKIPSKDPFEESGDKKYQEYDFEGAIQDYIRSLNVKSNNPEVHFKLACLYSNLEEIDNAFFHLEKAVEKGFYDFKRIKTHDNLAFLRTQSTFDDFVNAGYKLAK